MLAWGDAAKRHPRYRTSCVGSPDRAMESLGEQRLCHPCRYYGSPSTLRAVSFIGPPKPRERLQRLLSAFFLMPEPSQDPTRKLRVFLCHASADKKAVRRLHQRLVQDGMAPWLDEKDLLPGQNWRHEIPKVVGSSDVVLVSGSGLERLSFASPAARSPRKATSRNRSSSPSTPPTRNRQARSS